MQQAPTNWGGGNIPKPHIGSSPYRFPKRNSKIILKISTNCLTVTLQVRSSKLQRSSIHRRKIGSGNRFSKRVRILIANSGGVRTGSIVETAKGLINKDNPVPSQAYIDARAKYNPEAGDMNDCGKYVSTVMRASGADPDYPPGTSIQRGIQ